MATHDNIIERFYDDTPRGLGGMDSNLRTVYREEDDGRLAKEICSYRSVIGRRIIKFGKELANVPPEFRDRVVTLFLSDNEYSQTTKRHVKDLRRGLPWNHSFGDKRLTLEPEPFDQLEGGTVIVRPFPETHDWFISTGRDYSRFSVNDWSRGMSLFYQHQPRDDDRDVGSWGRHDVAAYGMTHGEREQDEPYAWVTLSQQGNNHDLFRFAAESIRHRAEWEVRACTKLTAGAVRCARWDDPQRPELLFVDMSPWVRSGAIMEGRGHTYWIKVHPTRERINGDFSSFPGLSPSGRWLTRGTGSPGSPSSATSDIGSITCAKSNTLSLTEPARHGMVTPLYRNLIRTKDVVYDFRQGDNKGTWWLPYRPTVFPVTHITERTLLLPGDMIGYPGACEFNTSHVASITAPGLPISVLHNYSPEPGTQVARQWLLHGVP